MKQMKKNYLSSIIFLALATLLIIFLIYYFFEEIKKNSEELVSQKQELISLNQEKESLEKIDTFYKNYQSNLVKVNELFIDKEVPIEFINFLEKLATTSQLLIEISPGARKETKEDPWSNLSFQLSLSGSFPNFLKFLEKLEASPYLIEVLNLNIKKLTQSELQSEKFKAFSAGDVKADILIKVFTQ